MPSRFRLLAVTGVTLAALALPLSVGAGAGPTGWKDHYGVVNAAATHLAFDGDVLRYSIAGDRVTVVRRLADVCQRTVWSFRGPSAGSSTSRVTVCAQGVAAPVARVRWTGGGTTVDVLRGGPDTPDRLRVSTRQGMRYDWPLLGHASAIDVSHGIAIYVSPGNGLFAIRLHDGRQALLGMVRAGDRPRILGSGVVYLDNLRKRETRAGRTRISFVPRAAVMRALDQAAGELTTARPITALAVDGPRVAFAVRDEATRCNRVMFWNVAWNHVARLTMPNGPSCPAKGTADRVTRLAIGGSRATWTMSSARGQTTVASSIIACVEMTVSSFRSGIGVSSVAGDGRVLAVAPDRYLSPPPSRVAPGLGITAVRPSVQARGIVGDTGRIAVLRGGQVELQTYLGRPLGVFAVPGARAIALRADRLVVLRASSVDVFSVSRRARLASWPVPRGTSPAIDAHYGVAVVVHGRTVRALDLRTGVQRVIARAPVVPRAEIEPIGVVYHYNRGGRGVIRVVPTAIVERALAR